MRNALFLCTVGVQVNPPGCVGNFLHGDINTNTRIVIRISFVTPIGGVTGGGFADPAHFTTAARPHTGMCNFAW
jgi:hypothetical protein